MICVLLRVQRSTVVALVLTALLTACDFQKQADAKFGDQHFKTAIALIELHKVRNGTYPNSLKDLQFTGEWDQIALTSVNYTKLENGYELTLTRGWVGTPELGYPKEFWQGLGIAAPQSKPAP